MRPPCFEFELFWLAFRALATSTACRAVPLPTGVAAVSSSRADAAFSFRQQHDAKTAVFGWTGGHLSIRLTDRVHPPTAPGTVSPAARRGSDEVVCPFNYVCRLLCWPGEGRREAMWSRCSTLCWNPRLVGRTLGHARLQRAIRDLT
jgi:hypothetical protein